jgi:hypothetical protein
MSWVERKMCWLADTAGLLALIVVGSEKRCDENDAFLRRGESRLNPTFTFPRGSPQLKLTSSIPFLWCCWCCWYSWFFYSQCSHYCFLYFLHFQPTRAHFNYVRKTNNIFVKSKTRRRTYLHYDFPVKRRLLFHFTWFFYFVRLALVGQGIMNIKNNKALIISLHNKFL